MAGRAKFASLKWARGVALGLSLLAVGAHDVSAQDPVSAARDLETSDDFRVRVSAALMVGRMRGPGALAALEHALGDPHPAVRIAAAAGLKALGDPAALPVLRAKQTSEASSGVRSQMATTIAALEALGGGADDSESKWQGTRYVVALGDMHNRSGVRGNQASDVLREATRSHAKSIPGALVSDRSDVALLQQAAARHVPVLLVEGALQHLNIRQKNTELTYNAQVDYSMRRVPQQQLRGMLSGSATSFGSVSSMHDANTVTLLEDQAIDGAVESALRGAAQGFGEAIR